jgi:hypothetical protein
MCQKRTKLVEEAFNKFDRNKDGLIDLYDIKYWYINTANSFGNLRLINDKINAVYIFIFFNSNEKIFITGTHLNFFFNLITIKFIWFG